MQSPHACIPKPCSMDLAEMVTSNYRDGRDRPTPWCCGLPADYPQGEGSAVPPACLPGLAWSWVHGAGRGVGDGGQHQGSQSLKLLGEVPFQGGWGGAEAQEWPLVRVQLWEDHSGLGEESKFV